MTKNKSVELGCGLIAIGREWGTPPKSVPSEKEAIEFLEFAFIQGIRFFDTAPAYGLSEERLGIFLKQLTQEQRNLITVATKLGEHWIASTLSTVVDHSYERLIQSLEHSLQLLGKIDILQLHKTKPDLVRNESVRKAFEYAKQNGIKEVGVSVSDAESVSLACADDYFTLIQLPYNQANSNLQTALQLANQHRKKLIINRPFNMGALVYKDKQEIDKKLVLLEAYQYILEQDFNGVILTGTKSPSHLSENIDAFQRAREKISHLR